MTLEPILNAPLAIQLHVITVVPAFFIGTWLLFFSAKGAPWHRTLGKIYLTLMVLTAIAAFFIHAVVGPTFYGFGLIHLFIPLVASGTYNGLKGAWTHNIPRHRRAMTLMYVGALLIAGGLTFLPGRIMHAVFFG
ncbi:hypothetical protein sos41_05880 [Alphaproteobacteria bacterium SO-S41]|nr:hypothetical protein sos41_05880 [Alphaproteobacteria bacterium SO-S41]